MSNRTCPKVTILICVLITIGSSLAIAGGTATAATGGSSDVGTWPGVGKICGPGEPGSSPARGVTSKSIDIATFADPGNTVQPGLDIEFFQAAKAFSAWCNAAGGINGRKIVVDNRDGALFNAAQVTKQACQSDFMSVAGGLALDSSSVSVRVACGLGQITSFTPSDASQGAALQVDPGGNNNNLVTAGWFSVLAKKYPKAVLKSSMGAQNNPSIIEPAEKSRQAAETLGWKVIDWQVAPLSVNDWTPYIDQLQSKGVEAVQPSDQSDIQPYVQAMNTAGYNPTLMLLNTQFYEPSTVKAAAQTKFPTTYVALGLWPFELASQSPGLEQLLSIMHKNSGGVTVDWDDETAFDSWILFAKSATACGSNLSVSCVLKVAASQRNWTGGGLAAPVTHLAMSNGNPTPSACFALLHVTPNKFVYDKSLTDPNTSIWNCDPKGVVRVRPVPGTGS